MTSLPHGKFQRYHLLCRGSYLCVSSQTSIVMVKPSGEASIWIEILEEL